MYEYEVHHWFTNFDLKYPSKVKKILPSRVAFSRWMHDSILFLLTFSLAHSYDMSSSSISHSATVRLQLNTEISHTGGDKLPFQVQFASKEKIYSSWPRSSVRPVMSSLGRKRHAWPRRIHVNTPYTTMRVPQHIIVCMDDILDPKNIVQPVIHMMRFSAPPKTKIQAPIRDLDLTFLRKKV